jgi:hypothetical protein
MIKLQHCIDSGVESSNGKIIKNRKIHTDLFYNKSNNEKCKDFCDSVFDEEPKLASSCFNECLTDKDFTKHLENLLE